MNNIYNIKMVRGDSFFSDKFMVLNETLPEYVTMEEIQAGLADGTYTAKDPSTLNVRGHVRAAVDDPVRFELPFHLSATDFYFEIKPEHTQNGSGEESWQFVYDVEITDNGVVSTIAEGTLVITPDVTSDANELGVQTWLI